MKNKQISVTLIPEAQLLIKQLAEHESKSISRVAQDAIYAHIKAQRTEPSKSKVSIFTGMKKKPMIKQIQNG